MIDVRRSGRWQRRAMLGVLVLAAVIAVPFGVLRLTPADAATSPYYELSLSGWISTKCNSGREEVNGGLVTIGRLVATDGNRQESHWDSDWSSCVVDTGGVQERPIAHFDAYLRSDGTAHVTGWLGAKNCSSGGCETKHMRDVDWIMDVRWPWKNMHGKIWHVTYKEPFRISYTNPPNF